MQEAIRSILTAIGENPDREGLLDTPKRVEKSLKYLMQGYALNPGEIIGKAIFHEECNHMIIVRNMNFIVCASIICYRFSANAISVTLQKIRCTE